MCLAGMPFAVLPLWQVAHWPGKTPWWLNRVPAIGVDPSTVPSGNTRGPPPTEPIAARTMGRTRSAIHDEKLVLLWQRDPAQSWPATRPSWPTALVLIFTPYQTYLGVPSWHVMQV